MKLWLSRRYRDEFHRVRSFVALFGAMRKEEHGGSRQDMEEDEEDGCDHSCVTLLKMLKAACGGWQLQYTLLYFCSSGRGMICRLSHHELLFS